MNNALTPLERALTAKLQTEINFGVSCNAQLIQTQEELARVKAELEKEKQKGSSPETG